MTRVLLLALLIFVLSCGFYQFNRPLQPVSGVLCYPALGGPAVPAPQDTTLNVGMDSPLRLAALGHMAYPPDLRVRGIDGEVAIQFVVDTAGRVERSSEFVQNATDLAFAKAACDYFAGTRYTPYVRAGLPRKVQVKRLLLHFQTVNGNPSQRSQRDAEPPNPRLQRSGRLSRYWLVSATEVVQVLCGWRAVARR